MPICRLATVTWLNSEAVARSEPAAWGHYPGIHPGGPGRPAGAVAPPSAAGGPGPGRAQLLEAGGPPWHRPCNLKPRPAGRGEVLHSVKALGGLDGTDNASGNGCLAGGPRGGLHDDLLRPEET